MGSRILLNKENVNVARRSSTPNHYAKKSLEKPWFEYQTFVKVS